MFLDTRGDKHELRYIRLGEKITTRIEDIYREDISFFFLSRCISECEFNKELT